MQVGLLVLDVVLDIFRLVEAGQTSLSWSGLMVLRLDLLPYLEVFKVGRLAKPAEAS